MISKPNGYDTTQAFGGGNARLTAGAHVCVITNAYMRPTQSGKQMLCCDLDINEGSEFDAMFRKKYDSTGKWACTFRTFIEGLDGGTSGFFKGLVEAVAKSNNGFDLFTDGNGNERTLAGKSVGMMFREEEFEGQDGQVHTSVKPFYAMSADDVRAGGWTTPNLKRLTNRPAASGFEPVVDDSDDLPF